MEDGALSRALDEFAADGIATIEGVFTSSECAEMRSLLDAAIEDATEGPGRTWGGFPAEEQDEMRDDDGVIVVDCAFCARQFNLEI